MWPKIIGVGTALFGLFTGCVASDGFERTTSQSITYGQLDGNGHPGVGGLVIYDEVDARWEFWCTATLIAPRIVLTAGHCTTVATSDPVRYSAVGIDFESDMKPIWEQPGDHIELGQAFTHPEYAGAGDMSRRNDYGIVVLDEPMTALPLAALPDVGLLDSMRSRNGLKGTKFTSVGFGLTEPVFGPGGPVLPWDGLRRVAVGSFEALNPDVLRISQNPSTGDAGTCNGDSGGPNFLGDSNVIAGITSMGDTLCRATNATFRVDTEAAQSFIQSFL